MSDEELNPDDPFPALIAELDQAMMVAPHMAALAWNYYISFKEKGFSERQSIYLTAVQLKETPGTAP